jgi:wyosine [tRNA(Phe)-imidazoG37] synthetase (radical SAM superfamily)
MISDCLPANKYIFGPVPSRRLGISLGVDLMPHKTCSLNCVYCECGETTNLTIEDGVYVPTDDVIEELSRFLSHKPEIDHITFSGSGEPTLHSGIQDIIKFVKTNHPGYKVALLTNGTMFFDPRIRKRVLDADIIIPSVDAGSVGVFRKINRPHPDLDLAEVIDGIAALKTEYKHKLMIEIFIIPGVNDTQDEIACIREALRKIGDVDIFLNSLDRPGAESWVLPADKKTLAGIKDSIYKSDIIQHSGGGKEYETRLTDCGPDIISTLRRRPCTLEDILKITGKSMDKVAKQLEVLVEAGEVETQRLQRGIFYKLKQ